MFLSNAFFHLMKQSKLEINITKTVLVFTKQEEFVFPRRKYLQKLSISELYRKDCFERVNVSF